MERLINDIKNDFESEIAKNDKRLLRLSKVKGELFNLTNQQKLFEMSEKERKAWEKQVENLTGESARLEKEIEAIKSNKIYEHAFEWRFEFPEVLDENGNFTGFDVVIGNPPYGVNFNKESGRQYEERFSTFNWRGESYILFIEKAIEILRYKGEFGFIMPDTLLNLGFTEKARLNILKKTKLREVILLPSNVFADATVDTILLFFQKTEGGTLFDGSEINVKTFNKKQSVENLEQPERKFTIPAKIWYIQRTFNVQSNFEELSILEKVDNTFPYLDKFSEMFSGIKVYEVGKGSPPQDEDIRNRKPFTSELRITNDWQPFFDGKHIGYYSLLWEDDNWIHYGPWLAAPRSAINFDDEKILIRKITGKTLIAHYIPYTSYCNTLLFVLKLNKSQAKISYKALLGIINSGFIGWYFRRKFQISDEDTFPQIMIRDILQFAVPNESNSLTKKIEMLVSKIIDQKKQNPNADTGAPEAEIDQLVYKLYGLTDEEIKIVEGQSG